ncbi:MAG TPA: antitoxin Xre/MbcA/ParS toxin-binding domain-containing protein [Burkholderiales bacterium]|nr:antitoxin Xre/MbcA/ParS toxin-binding domain-containing protein [Burkholderiales bacterium]
MDHASGGDTCLDILTGTTGLTAADLAGLLDVSVQSLESRVAEGRLQNTQRHRIRRIVRVLETAQRVLGAHTRGLNWLRNPNRATNFRAPIDLLQTARGTERVLLALERIERGGFA